MPFLDSAKADRFRVFTSLYEALNVQNQMTCDKKGMDYLPLWFLYSIVVMNILLVLNASSNFLIYLFAGNSFRDQVQTFFRRVRKNDISSFRSSKGYLPCRAVAPMRSSVLGLFLFRAKISSAGKNINLSHTGVSIISENQF